MRFGMNLLLWTTHVTPAHERQLAFVIKAGADIVYTDVWASMGQEKQALARAEAFAGYTVTEELMAKAKDDAIFMHCLPAHREEEVSEAVLEGPQSVVYDEAENRLHAQKALMVFLVNASKKG